MIHNRLIRFLLQAVVPVALIALWWITSSASRSIYYPPLGKVVTSLRKDWLFENVRVDLVPSLARFFAGYALAALGGIAAGTAIGLVRPLSQATRPVTEFIRAIPPPLLLPFAIVALGTTDLSKVVVIAIGSVWTVLLNTVDGVRGVDPLQLEMAKSFRVPRHRQIRQIVLRAAAPQIAVGLRTAVSVGLILMIISEMQASTNGLGYRVLNAQRSFNTTGMFAGIIVIGVVGLALNGIFVLVEGRVLRWHRGARGLLRERRSTAAPTAAPAPAPPLPGPAAAPAAPLVLSTKDR